MLTGMLSIVYKNHKVSIGNNKVVDLESTSIRFQPREGRFPDKHSEFHLN